MRRNRNAANDRPEALSMPYLLPPLFFCLWVIWEHLRFNCRRNAKIRKSCSKKRKYVYIYVVTYEQMCRLAYLAIHTHTLRHTNIHTRGVSLRMDFQRPKPMRRCCSLFCCSFSCWLLLLLSLLLLTLRASSSAFGQPLGLAWLGCSTTKTDSEEPLEWLRFLSMLWPGS